MVDGFMGKKRNSAAECEDAKATALRELEYLLANDAIPKEYERELVAREAASSAYHDHPSHPTSCQAYDEHHGTIDDCPCEDDWLDFPRLTA